MFVRGPGDHPEEPINAVPSPEYNPAVSVAKLIGLASGIGSLFVTMRVLNGGLVVGLVVPAVLAVALGFVLFVIFTRPLVGISEAIREAIGYVPEYSPDAVSVAKIISLASGAGSFLLGMKFLQDGFWGYAEIGDLVAPAVAAVVTSLAAYWAFTRPLFIVSRVIAEIFSAILGLVSLLIVAAMVVGGVVGLVWVARYIMTQ